MRLSPLVALIAVLALVACEVKPQPPVFTVEMTPKGAAVEGGDEIKFSCRKQGLEKTAYTYETQIEGDCAFEKVEDKGYVCTYRVDPDCLGGKGRFVATAKTEGGMATQEVSFDLHQKLYPKEVLPARLAPMPSVWYAIDTFDEMPTDPKDPKARDNLVGGVRDVWNFNNSGCKTQAGPEGTLQIDLALPLQISQCGFVEHLKVARTEVKKGGKTETREEYQAIDLKAYKAITFAVKSADAKKHAFQLEIVDFDPLSLSGQGNVYTSDEILIAKPYWRRYEFPIADLPKGLAIERIRSIGFKFDGKQGFSEDAAGAVLVDAIALIR